MVDENVVLLSCPFFEIVAGSVAQDRTICFSVQGEDKWNMQNNFVSLFNL